MEQEALRFLSAVTASCPDDEWGYLWTLSADGETKHTHWFQTGDIERVAGLATDLGQTTNVYFGVGTSDRKRGTKQRVKLGDASGIYGLWADVDIRNPDAHKKLNLPGSIEEATEVLNIGGLAPTALVDSGHGLHAWWVFGDFWSFESAYDREEAANLALMWHETLKIRAAERGWIVDSVFDLSRVLRVPGTMNFKGEPTEVRILDCEPGRTYSPSDFAEHFADDAEINAARTAIGHRVDYVTDTLKLVAGAEPPWDKVDIMNDFDSRFRASMDWDRPEFADQSPSSYDMSLATMAAGAGWEDQEIANLIIHVREQHGERTKFDNPGYYTRTISKANIAAAKEKAFERIEAVAQEAETLLSEDNPDEEAKSDTRRSLFDVVSPMLGLEVTGMVRYISDPPEFAISIGPTTVPLGAMGTMSNQRDFSNRVLASDVQEKIPSFKTTEWNTIITALRKACRDQEVGREATEAGAMTSWLFDFLADRVPMESAEEGASSEYPYFNETGRVCIFPVPFVRWLASSRGERPDAKRIGKAMVLIGANTGTSHNGRQVWVLPSGFAGMKRRTLDQSTS